MEVMTIGTLYLALQLINELITFVKITLGVALIVVAIVTGLLLHDEYKLKIEKEKKANASKVSNKH